MLALAPFSFKVYVVFVCLPVASSFDNFKIAKFFPLHVTALILNYFREKWTNEIKVPSPVASNIIARSQQPAASNKCASNIMLTWFCSNIILKLVSHKNQIYHEEIWINGQCCAALVFLLSFFFFLLFVWCDRIAKVGARKREMGWYFGTLISKPETMASVLRRETVETHAQRIS